MTNRTVVHTPSFLREMLMNVPDDLCALLEEIRIRQGRPLELIVNGRSWWLDAEGHLTAQEHRARRADAKLCREILDRLTGQSVYSFEEPLRRGFITAEGGHRVGLSGTVSIQDGKVKLIREVTSFNVRIARQCQGMAGKLMPWLYDGPNKAFFHTLIISPPQHGKTTLLRDLARQVSDGFVLTSGNPVAGQKVAIVDERSEIAGCVRGVPQFDVGMRTDVLDQCPKAEGMMMMIRSMSPNVLVVDEIGHAADVEALREVLLAGVKVFASAHGERVQEVLRRPMLAPLHQLGLFQRFVCLQRKSGTHTFIKVYDGTGRCLTTLLEQNR